MQLNSLRNLGVLCVSAVTVNSNHTHLSLTRTLEPHLLRSEVRKPQNHRRDAEDAEGAQRVDFTHSSTGLPAHRLFGCGRSLANPVASLRASIIVAVVLFIYAPQTVAQTNDSSAPSNLPRVFLLNVKQLAATKKRIQRGDKEILPALLKLQDDAQKALTAGPFSVTTKTVTPPSGDKRDYMSQAPYFWPDPKSSSGLPYVRRDGERNPEIDKINNHRVLDDMRSAVETLALTYYFKGDDSAAAAATKMLRAFFLDPKTRMNPNLQFAQGIPGINTGRGIGLIETRGLTRVVDAIGLLGDSKSWTDADQRGMENWFEQFLQWMLDSKYGKDESASKNNHGTYYDLQVVSFALFLNRTDMARNVLETAKQKRIAFQIEPDGRQPLELARTKGWSYSAGNLDGLMLLARIGENVGVDLWNYQTQDGRSIRKALDFLIPFAFGEKKWPYQQLGDWPPQMLFSLIRRAAEKYADPEIQSLLTKLPPADAADRRKLLSP